MCLLSHTEPLVANTFNLNKFIDKNCVPVLKALQKNSCRMFSALATGLHNMFGISTDASRTNTWPLASVAPGQQMNPSSPHISPQLLEQCKQVCGRLAECAGIVVWTCLDSGHPLNISRMSDFLARARAHLCRLCLTD